ncbi:MAG: ABC transporter substrate-binding protein [Candidatus Levyibacteriota bacterium]
MIFFKRKRLIIWLVRAYLKKHGRTILLFFAAGILSFLILFLTKDFFVARLPFIHRESVGLVGSYDVNTLPSSILLNISRGLTAVDGNGKITPSLATSWKIEDGGKKYTFKIKKGVFFSDDEEFTSKSINYDFSDVKVERPDDYTIVFKLKDNYSPFLVTVSRPIFKKGFVGVGEYKLRNLKLNGNFVESMSISSRENKYETIVYQFYPTQQSLKTAFVLGEVSDVSGLSDVKFQNTTLESFKSVRVSRNINSEKLVALFYNTQDSTLSDNKVRKALTHALPDSFPLGLRNASPFQPNSWARSESIVMPIKQDYNHAKLLLEEASGSGKLSFEIKTLPQYEDSAKIITDAWKKLNVNANIKVVESIPSTFQIFLGDFNLSKDPDEYPLWHSSQPSNITKYRNLRIDKLLEDGRKEVNVDERKKIYANFEKYILDDSPASFLYIPYSYEVSRL